MKKIAPLNKRQHYSPLLKLLVVMKLALLILLFTAYQVQAGVYGQKITLRVQQTEIKQILNKIEKKIDVRFLYNYDLIVLNKKIDFSVDNLDLMPALNKLFENSALGYRILNNNLVVIIAADSAVAYQPAEITGIVTGESDQPLAGVTVKVKGSNNGTYTDSKGAFKLTADDKDVLLISYIGYNDFEMPLSGKHQLTIKLTLSSKQLDQVVVIGYGSQLKRNVTGAVSVVTAADIVNRPIVNTAEALQGKAAGVQVTSNSGKPGAGLTIRIRGSSSISAGNDPLYIVDGIPTTDISAYNPNDVESISVLKDAASASIYGTRAANGVVVITTKKGAIGKSQIDFNTYYGTSTPTSKFDVLNAQQYQQYMNETFGEGTISDSLVKTVNFNWPDEVFRRGNQVNYQLAISGGNEKTQHYISLDYNDQTGTIKPAEFNRFNGRINITTKATNWLTLITSALVSREHNNDVTDNASVARGGVVLSALGTPPTVPKYNADGSIAQNPLTGWENPLGAIEGSTTKNLNDRLISNIGADVKLYKGLTFQSRFGIDYENDLHTYFEDPFLTQDGRNNQGSLSQSKSNSLVWLSEQTLNYTTQWGQNHLSALAGWTVQNSHFDQTNISASMVDTQYRHEPWDQMFARAKTKQPSTKSIDDWALVSYLGRISYDFAGKYLVQANIRSDQSSKFAPGNRTATFPSFSAGWRISQENFMQDVAFLSDLKLRAGWGQNGNQEGVGSYEYLSLSGFDNTGNPGAETIASEDLRWETTTQTNIGIDASFFKGRISFTGDFYIKRTKDVLVRLPLSSQIVPSILLNMGSVKNTGEEFVISTKNIVNRDFTWSTDFNISLNKNEVLSIGNGINALALYGYIYDKGYATRLVQGYGLGEFYGYVAAGVDPATGDQLYLNSEGKAVPYSRIKPSDRQLIGSAQPDFVYGMTNNLSYKNFDLTVFVQGSQGNQIFNGIRIDAEGLKDSRNQSTAVLNRWKQPGDITNVPGAKPYSNDNAQISTRFLEDGSYLRFKTITLAYRFQPNLINRLGLSAASIYISAQNLITLTKYTGFDPEVNSYGNDGSSDQRNISIGVDYGAYPQSKVFLVGINISLK